MAYGARQVPQNIMNVEFKVFDFLTVKQFFITIAVVLINVLLYFVLPPGWNVTIVTFISILSFIFLFVPFNGEPFLVFLSNYIEAMITEQRRVWHKKGVILKSAAQKALYYRYGEEVPLSKVDSYLAIGKNMNKNNDIDKLEQEFLSKSNQLQEEVENKLQTQQNKQFRENNLTHTSPMPSDTFGILNLNQLNSSSNYVNNSETNIKRESDVELKNFIFGYLEDENENPISGALISLKLNNTQNDNLELLITNVAGEFKTLNEYKEGEYFLIATKDNKKLAELKIYHNPIDPEPIILSNKAQNITANNISNQNSNLELTDNIQKSNNDVFDGDYDPNYFSVNDLINTIQESKLNSSNDKDKQISTNTTDVSNSLKINSNYTNTIEIQNNKLEQQLPQQGSASSNNIYAYTSNNDFINFLGLPNTVIDQYLNTELIYLFNTINGCIKNKIGEPLKDIKIKIYDKNGNLVNSIVSDKFGYFYSISPLPNGNYFITFTASNHNLNSDNILLKCFVVLNGLVIHPKLVVLNV